MSQNRTYEVVVWGASGFTGRLIAEYLFKTYGANGSLKWAMAGRNQSKLEKVRAEMADDSVPLIVADSQDEASLEAMCQQTKVMCTTVGPYAKYGSKLVAACIKHQTHYCDLAGEVQWMRKMIDTHHAAALANGTKIVHTCGFDSIPSDLGVYFFQKEIKERTGEYATQIRMRVKAMKGEMSGGTYASMSYMQEQAKEDKSIIKDMMNPYGLNPRGEQTGPDKKDLMKVVYDDTTKGWLMPFVMAGINTKVVRRSNALAGYPYGKDFLYDEAMMTGSGVGGRMKATMGAIGLGVVMGAKPGSFMKKMVDSRLPKPGEGPDKNARENGFYNLLFFANTKDGQAVSAKVTGDRDPGYGSTSKMLAESAICLAKDDLPEVAGMLTPAVAMGDALIERLVANAGLTFSYKES